MSPKKLIPFLVVLLVLAGLVAWRKASEKKPGTIVEQVKLETLAGDALKAEDIARVELYAGSKPEEKVVLAKEGDAWKITSLHNAPADKETVDKFVKSMVGLKGEFRATAEGDEKLAAFELKDDQAFHAKAYKDGSDTPAVDVLVGKTADSQTDLLRQSAPAQTVFIRKAGDSRVHVESTNLRRDAGVADSGENAVPKPTKWLETELLALDKTKITRVALTLPDKELVFERHEKPAAEEPPKEEKAEGDEAAPEAPKAPEYEWKLASGGFDQKFSNVELETLLGRFTNLTVTNVADPAKKAEIGFEPPQYKAVVSLEGQDDVVLLGGRTAPGQNAHVQVASGGDALIYEMNKINFEQVFIKGAPMFTLPALAVAKDKAARVEVTQPDGKVVVAQADGKWALTEPVYELEKQQLTVDNLVNTAAALKAVDYADGVQEDASFDKTILIESPDGNHTVRLGGPSKCIEGVYARFDDNPATLVVSKTDAAKLLAPARDYYVMAVLGGHLDDVSRIEFTGDGGPFAVAKSGETWSLEKGGATTPVPNDLVEDFLSTARGFQLAGPVPGQPAVLENAAFSLVCRNADGTAASLEFGPEADGRHRVVLGGASTLFDAEAPVVAQLREALNTLANPPAPEPLPVPETLPMPAAEAPAAPAPVSEISHEIVELPVPAAAAEAPVEAAAPEAPAVPAEAVPAAPEAAPAAPAEAAPVVVVPEPAAAAQ